MAHRLVDRGDNMSEENTKLRCPCGDIILADTEDWPVPLCYNCYPEHLVHENEILRGQCVFVTKDTQKYKDQIINWMLENQRWKKEINKLRNEIRKLRKMGDKNGKNI